MATNRVTIQIDAKDNASGVFNKLKSAFDALDSKAKQASNSASSGFKNLSGSLTGAIVSANLLTSALGAAVGVVGNLSGKLFQAFDDYATYQTESTFTAGALARATGITLNDATIVMNDALTALNEAANKLPGTSADFRTIGMSVVDDIAEVSKGLDGKLDAKKLNESLVNIGSLGGVLASQGINAQKVGLDFQAALVRNASELKQLQTFQAGEGKKMLDAWVEEVQNLYGTSFNDATVQQRVEALSKLKSRFLTGETIDKLGQSIDAIMSTFQSTIFDTKNGLLGFDKDLDEATEGNQSVGATYTRIIAKIFGSDGIFAKVGKVLQSIGFDDTSILDAIAGGLGRLGSLLDRLGNWLDGLALDFRLDRQDFNFLDVIDRLTVDFFAWVNSVLTDLNNSLDTVDVANQSANVGDRVGQILVKAIGQIDEQVVAELVVKAVIGATALGAQAIASFLIRSLKEAGEDFVTKSMDEINSFFNLFIKLNNMIGDFLESVVNKVGSMLSRVGVNVPTIDLGNVEELETGRFERLQQQRRVEQSSESGNQSPNLPSGNSVRGFAFGMPDFITSLFRTIDAERERMPSGSDIAIANTSEAILNRSQQSDLTEGILSRIQPRLALNIPTFTPTQVQPEVNQRQPTVPTSSPISFGDINIYSQASDPRQVAVEVMAEIERRFTKFQQNQVTAVAT